MSFFVIINACPFVVDASVILDVNVGEIFDPAIAASEATFAFVTAPLTNSFVSTELLVGLLKPNFYVVSFLSILKEVPVNAHTPRGFSLRLSKLFKNLFLSLVNIST